jgi:hypothetical protein
MDRDGHKGFVVGGRPSVRGKIELAVMLLPYLISFSMWYGMCLTTNLQYFGNPPSCATEYSFHIAGDS